MGKKAAENTAAAWNDAGADKGGWTVEENDHGFAVTHPDHKDAPFDFEVALLEAPLDPPAAF